MKTERPKIRPPFKPVDVIIEMLSITILILMWLHLILEYSSLPETIPSHFNASGKPDAYGHKSYLWFIPAFATVMYLALFVLNRFPHLHNYMVNITIENALKHYQFSTLVLRVVNFLCTTMFAYISYQIVDGSKTNELGLGMSFVFIVVAVSLLLPVFILIYQQKLKKN